MIRLAPGFMQTLSKIKEQRPEVRFVLPAATEVVSELRAIISDKKILSFLIKRSKP